MRSHFPFDRNVLAFFDPFLTSVASAPRSIFASVRRIEEFKNEKIIPHIIREEAEEGNFLKYLFAQDVLCKDQTYSLIEDGDKK